MAMGSSTGDDKESGEELEKHLILVGSDDLLGRAVELFVSNCGKWAVNKIAHAQQATKLIDEIAQLHPDVVIICQSDLKEESSLPYQLMKKNPYLKVITVNYHDNSIEVYKKHKVWVKEISDLLDVVAS
jgi:hypothetical protein